MDRLFLALLTSAYDEEEVDGEVRKVLRFHPSMAPVKVAVFPLVKNKPEIMDKARGLFEKLQAGVVTICLHPLHSLMHISTFQMRYNCDLDVAGTIGKRYRRADETGAVSAR